MQLEGKGAGEGENMGARVPLEGKGAGEGENMGARVPLEGKGAVRVQGKLNI